MTPASCAARRAAETAARDAYGRLLSILAAETRDIAAAEDLLAEAFAAALATWPVSGAPRRPEAWLLTAARNRMKSDARRAAVQDRGLGEVMRRLEAGEQDAAPTEIPDERLRLMLVCAHPAIDPAARTPLILQCVLGFQANRIAEAFLTPPATMSQRLVRAKAKIRDAGVRFALPERADVPERLGAVLDAIYAAFGRGWDGLESADGPFSFTSEALWLARLLLALAPAEPEVKGLLALMLYCTARREARRDAEGRFVPLDRQDPTRWNRRMIDEAEALLAAASEAGRFGRYQCEAAIQSVHVAAASGAGPPLTNRAKWDALRVLYDMLAAHHGGLGGHVGRAVVIAEAESPEAGLSALDALPQERVAAYQPYWAARAHIAEALGDRAAALCALDAAMRLTADPAVRDYLEARRRAIGSGEGPM